MLDRSSSAAFAKDVLLKEGFVLVNFWAEWCKPCERIMFALHDIDKDYSHKVKIFNINSDENSGLTAMLRITSIPTVILFKDGKEIKRLLGGHDKPELLYVFSDMLL